MADSILSLYSLLSLFMPLIDCWDSGMALIDCWDAALVWRSMPCFHSQALPFLFFECILITVFIRTE